MVSDPLAQQNVRIGVAGHNLFDVAFAHLLAERRGVGSAVDFEMLIGMAPIRPMLFARLWGT